MITNMIARHIQWTGVWPDALYQQNQPALPVAEKCSMFVVRSRPGGERCGAYFHFSRNIVDQNEALDYDRAR